jgi:hypothetical protein
MSPRSLHCLPLQVFSQRHIPTHETVYREIKFWDFYALRSSPSRASSLTEMLDSWSRLSKTQKKADIYDATTIIFPVALYGSETWSLTLREEHRLKVFENRVLRRTSGPKRDEVVGGCWKLHNEELHNLYASSYTSRMIKAKRMRWAEHLTRIGEKRNASRSLVGKPEGKIQQGKYRRWGG